MLNSKKVCKRMKRQKVNELADKSYLVLTWRERKALLNARRRSDFPLKRIQDTIYSISPRCWILGEQHPMDSIIWKRSSLK
ncbi:hypothetical protein HNY73_011806 [Argiope bruennichi]|uniref:Uncharacterized protein n=1 Tax=Argiope bruennichi TaxID=94029 RepID=A0A8T0EXF2_ARGBR|nr:hypothetical protein HNY73_011806 [Argiope bruennichi]